MPPGDEQNCRTSFCQQRNKLLPCGALTFLITRAWALPRTRWRGSAGRVDNHKRQNPDWRVLSSVLTYVRRAGVITQIQRMAISMCAVRLP
ncbi:hypothetical protein KCP75_13915 [Salmonella enterica subsp. enterica]|nr:hypothetical protein KCP75_13915 [Salmonella enterica subsp. enterica]